MYTLISLNPKLSCIFLNFSRWKPQHSLIQLILSLFLIYKINFFDRVPQDCQKITIPSWLNVCQYQYSMADINHRSMVVLWNTEIGCNLCNLKFTWKSYMEWTLLPVQTRDVTHILLKPESWALQYVWCISSLETCVLQFYLLPNCCWTPGASRLIHCKPKNNPAIVTWYQFFNNI